MSLFDYRGAIVAADAATEDYFGTSVALSGDGAIMAVGAIGWEGSTTNQGGVYILDWGGSSWSQRGSVLVSASPADELFGISVALSSDGTVLAVGASLRLVSGAARGAVYVYDWTGSAWVQRGSVLTASGGAEFDTFGCSVALSGDGAMLVVGAQGRDGTGEDEGAVYTYTWSGSAWVLSGSVLVSPSPYEFEAFGSVVAISSDATVLAVNTGAGPYVFDRSGSAWVDRGVAPTAGASAFSNFFGVGLGLNLDGSLLLVRGYDAANNLIGVFSFSWSGSAWTLNGTDAFSPEVSGIWGFSGDGLALSEDGQVLAVGGYELGATDTGTVFVWDAYEAPGGTGTPEAPTELTIIQAGYVAEAPTQLTIYATGTPEAPTALAIIDTAQPARWTLRCILADADVSDRLTGVQEVEADEGAARVAAISLLPPAGALDVLDYVGVSVSLDFVRVVGGVSVAERVFTGRVDTPVYDVASRTLNLSCTDDMQNRVAALSIADLDELILGRFTEAVQGKQDDHWDYAVARMSTVPGSLDCDAAGGIRVTLWDGLPLYATLEESELLWPRTEVAFPQRTSIRNRVEIDYGYRYARLRQRYTTAGFSATRADMDKCGYVYPSFSEIYSAVSGAGWVVEQSLHTNPPATIPHSTGGVVRPRADACDMAIFWLTQRHGQAITEEYSILVEAPESIAQNGTLPHSLTGALEETGFDYQAWESDYAMPPLLPGGGEQDYAPTATREASDYAIQTLLDQARVVILGSHRGASASNATPCNPRIDLDKRIRVETDDLVAEGKVRHVRHVFDLGAGTAITEFSLALFGAGGAGIITPDDLDPPEAPDEEERTGSSGWTSGVPFLTVNVYPITPYSESIMGLLVNPEQFYTVEDVPDGLGGFETISYENPHYVEGSYDVTGFRVEMPGVDDGDRQPATLPVAQSYSILIPEDTLTITVPA